MFLFPGNKSDGGNTTSLSEVGDTLKQSKHKIRGDNDYNHHNLIVGGAVFGAVLIVILAVAAVYWKFGRSR